MPPLTAVLAGPLTPSRPRGLGTGRSDAGGRPSPHGKANRQRQEEERGLASHSGPSDFHVHLDVLNF